MLVHEACAEKASTYSREQSCSVFPFFKPRICSLEGSGIADVETRTGPAHTVSKSVIGGQEVEPHQEGTRHQIPLRSTTETG